MRLLDLPPPPWIVGHRGTRESAPENTIESVLAAVAQGADMVEIDLQLSRDGHLVVFHDRLLPVAGGDPEPVARLTLEEIRDCRPVWRYAASERTYRVPTLSEVLAAAPPALPINLELKRHAADTDPERLIAALVRGIEGRERILVSSFDVPLLAVARERLPDLPLAPLAGKDADWRQTVRQARRLGAASIHVHRRLAADLLERQLLGPVAAGRPVLAYTVNRTAEARQLLRRGLAGLFTDHPGALRRRLREPR